jgi:hypothetical protein
MKISKTCLLIHEFLPKEKEDAEEIANETFSN